MKIDERLHPAKIDNETSRIMEIQATVMHPPRRLIVMSLIGEDRTHSDIMAETGLKYGSVNHNMGPLLELKIVEVKYHGEKKVYFIPDDLSDMVKGLVEYPIELKKKEAK